VNKTDVSGKTLVQRLLDYRNRAAQLRILSEKMHDGPALLMLGIAAGYDSQADTVHAILLQSADLV
jgi:hypothetical protein